MTVYLAYIAQAIQITPADFPHAQAWVSAKYNAAVAFGCRNVTILDLKDRKIPFSVFKYERNASVVITSLNRVSTVFSINT